MRKITTIRISIILTMLLFIGLVPAMKAQNFKIKKVKQLTEGKTQFCNPVFSPNGKQIAYTKTGYNGIYLMNADGTNQKQLVDDIGAGYKFTWSLDNEQIAFRGTDFENNLKQQYVATFNLKNNKKEVAFNKCRRIQPPHWVYKAEGKQLAYIKDNDVVKTKSKPYADASYKKLAKRSTNKTSHYKNSEVYVVSENGDFKKLEGKDCYNPVMSPNGKKIVFNQREDLIVMNIDGTNRLNIGLGYHPSWSPDGKYIIYQIAQDDGYFITESDLYIANVSTGKIIELTSTKDQLEANPCWSPNGKQVVYNCEKSGVIYAIEFE